GSGVWWGSTSRASKDLWGVVAAPGVVVRELLAAVGATFCLKPGECRCERFLRSSLQVTWIASHKTLLRTYTLSSRAHLTPSS
ncbi:MAG: hypothetical protein K6V36_13075, partial [Anaerolineae bacterium]|nr:hypothetical protein [Anaerolineae bacterium]